MSRGFSLINTPTLETDRLLLRKFNEGDLSSILQMFGDKEVNKYLPWFPVKTLLKLKSFMKITT